MIRDDKLSVDFAGVKLPSPIGVGAIATFMGRSIPDEMVAKILLKSTDAGAGYISVGALSHMPEDFVQKRRRRLKKELKTSEPPTKQLTLRQELK